MLMVFRGSDVPSQLATGTFTGEAWRDTLFSPADGVAVGNVFFAPCSRTYWHSHVGGQLLIVLAGQGIVGTEGEQVTVNAGDMIWTPPGARHWHGATASRYLLHTAVTVGDTHWEQAVSDETYNQIAGA